MNITKIMAAGPVRINPDEVGVERITNPDAVVADILGLVYLIAGVVCVIVIVVAGYMYTTSGGDASGVKRGKNAILGAVIGLVVILMAFTITQFVLGRF